MPWKLVREGSQWCLAKQDTGEHVKGSCHDDRAKTVAMMRALYASERDANRSALAGSPPKGT